MTVVRNQKRIDLSPYYTDAAPLLGDGGSCGCVPKASSRLSLDVTDPDSARFSCWTLRRGWRRRRAVASDRRFTTNATTTAAPSTAATTPTMAPGANLAAEEDDELGDASRFPVDVPLSSAAVAPGGCARSVDNVGGQVGNSLDGGGPTGVEVGARDSTGDNVGDRTMESVGAELGGRDEAGTVASSLRSGVGVGVGGIDNCGR